MTSAAFVGRAAELSQIEARLGRAAAGGGGLIVVSGEAGMGKTVLAEVAAERARAAGFDVAWSGCWQTAAVPPLWPWSQVLRQLAGSSGTPPELATEGGDVDAGRVEQFARVTDWLRHATASPVLVVLDDLHWADAGTLALLGHVASVAPSLRLLAIGTARPVDASTGQAYSEAAGQLRRWGHTLELRGLSTGEVADLVAGATGRQPAVAAASSLRELTGGNPLFARELSRSIGVDLLDRAVDPTVLVVPSSVQEIVAERLALLPERCQRLLEAVAVTGDEAPLDLLGVVVGGEPGGVLPDADSARRAGLVGVDGNAVSFAHALFRAAVYDGLSLSARTELHDRIGRGLLARRDAGVVVDPAALAHHFGRSAPLGNARLAHAFSLEAARDAEAMLSFDLAATRYRQALAMLAVEPDLGPRGSLLLDLADALVATGDFEGARRAFAEAADAARRSGDAATLGRAALGYSGGIAGIEVLVGQRDVCDLLEEASRALANDLVVGAMVDARLSVALSYLEPLAVRVPLAEGARERAERGDDPVATVLTLAAVCDVLAGPDHVDQRADAAQEIVRVARSSADRRAELLGRRLLVEALVERGDVAGAAAEVDRFEQAAERLARSEYSWYPALWRASFALARGDVDEYRQARLALDRIASEAGGTNATLLATVLDIARAMDTDDLVPARAALAEIGDMDVPSLEVQFATTLVRCRLDTADPRTLRAEAEQLLERALAAELDSEWLPMMAQLADVVGHTRDAPAAARLLSILEPYRGVWVIEGIAAGIRGPIDRMLGVLAAVVGDHDGAREHFDAARDAVTRAGAPFLVAVVDRARGLALDEPDLAAGALPLLREFGHPDEAQGPPSGNRFVRAGDTWSITFDRATFALRDSKGLGDLARLLASPGRELAALDLAAPGGSVVAAGTGPALDTRARDAYRARLVAIEAELDEADGNGDIGRSAGLAAERDALVAELTGAYGLGGRERTSGASAERARTAVRSRVRDALKRIGEAHPTLGRHLERSVRTGTFCVYDPDPPVEWELSSHIVRSDLTPPW